MITKYYVVIRTKTGKEYEFEVSSMEHGEEEVNEALNSENNNYEIVDERGKVNHYIKKSEIESADVRFENTYTRDDR